MQIYPPGELLNHVFVSAADLFEIQNIKLNLRATVNHLKRWKRILSKLDQQPFSPQPDEDGEDGRHTDANLQHFIDNSKVECTRQLLIVQHASTVSKAINDHAGTVIVLKIKRSMIWTVQLSPFLPVLSASIISRVSWLLLLVTMGVFVMSYQHDRTAMLVNYQKAVYLHSFGVKKKTVINEG